MNHIDSVGVLHPIIPNLLALVSHAPKRDVQIKKKHLLLFESIFQNKLNLIKLIGYKSFGGVIGDYGT